MTGLKLAVKAGATGDNRITLAIDPAIGNAEGYRLEVDRSGMKLTGGSAAGVFYGVQTIRKSVPHVTAEPVVFPAVEISAFRLSRRASRPLPRFAALAENQWSTAPKDLDGLLRRMPQMLDQYRANDYRFAPHLLSDPRVSDK